MTVLPCPSAAADKYLLLALNGYPDARSRYVLRGVSGRRYLMTSAPPARRLVLRLCNFLEAIEFHFPVRKDDPLPKPIDVDYYPELDLFLQPPTRKETKLRKIFRFAPLVPTSRIDVDIYRRVIWIG
jgi:hypothetical protein